ncbi:D-alanyl-D-alanine carboxypeptidase (penicillin-binding protein 5/6) [Caminicella sporogenes DSM 14501]|uniref:serine-type D-Ala-D-Ala carboxypeptidase n=1 Tax=Caminicella sporogenes DSM 14501 TaxID=1121266 RepID=A0A1M6L3M8_9FIRM|nr:D-alanyl-D-alanine carboxypeptidase family protein [Caminicella sporogenes]SHJ65818.1 D-alanyl-D-alanine carboxypeptidase (penicillin-binding protein 5/6) [Caminicella sporogenes DSM 14501]
MKYLNLKKFICLIIISALLIPNLSWANSASSAIVMEVRTGRILYAKNIHKKLPMASTTKIMTALLAVENSNLDEKVKIPPNAVGIEGSSIYLRSGEIITLEDLLYGLMLCSGNDAAVAIANYISGSVEEFVKLMNKRAKEIGAKNTNFMNPHGLHHKNHYTTAYDLALITRKALLNDEFKKIVSTKRWIANRKGYNCFYNKNKTLRQFSGGDGVKIGYTKAAGRCLVASATRNGMQIISVVLNDYNWFEDCYNLMEESFKKYRPYKVLSKNKRVKSFTVLNGKKNKSYLAVKQDIIIPVKKEEEKKVIVVFENRKKVQAPVAKGQILGKAKVYIGDKLLATADLIATEDIRKNSFLDFIKNIFKRK